MHGKIHNAVTTKKCKQGENKKQVEQVDVVGRSIEGECEGA